MLITATWKVTLGGVILLDWTDCMSSEPAIARRSVVEQVNPIRADYATFIPRKNVSHALSFSRVRKCGTPSFARNFMLQHTSSLPFRQAVECIIYLTQDDVPETLTLQGAVLQPDGYQGTTESERFLANYKIVGGALTNYPLEGDLTDMIAAPDYLAYTPGTTPHAGAGNTDISGTPDFIAIDVAAGIDEGADYTRTFSLLEPMNPGAEREFYIEIPASAHPTIAIRNLTSGGTSLVSLPGDATRVRKVNARLRWTGTAWKAFSVQEQQ